MVSAEPGQIVITVAAPHTTGGVPLSAPIGVPTLRVCILTEAFYPIVGGGETHSRMLSERLHERGLSVLVVTRGDDRRPSAGEHVGRTLGVRVSPSGFKRLGKYLMMLPALGELVRCRKQAMLFTSAGSVSWAW